MCALVVYTCAPNLSPSFDARTLSRPNLEHYQLSGALCCLRGHRRLLVESADAVPCSLIGRRHDASGRLLSTPPPPVVVACVARLNSTPVWLVALPRRPCRTGREIELADVRLAHVCLRLPLAINVTGERGDRAVDDWAVRFEVDKRDRQAESTIDSACVRGRPTGDASRQQQDRGRRGR